MNTATHPIALEELMAFLDRELPAAQAQTVTEHLKQCGDCSNLAAQLGETKHQLAAWQVESLPSAVEAKIQQAALKLTPRPQGFASILVHRMFWALPRKPILALCGVVIAVLFLSRSGRSPRDSIFEGYLPSARSPRIETSKATSSNAGVRGADQWALQASPPAGANDFLLDRATTRKATRSSNSSAYAFRADGEAWEDKSPAAADRPPPAAAPIHAPMIARSVSLTIVVKNFAASRSSLEAILARHHGYPAQLSASTSENAQRSITASLRVPANELAATLAELKTLGHVENESQSGEEVTQQHADLVARLKNSRGTEQRLQAILLQRTGKIADVLAVEEEISRVRGEIEEMEAEQKSLEHRLDFATIELRISEEYKAQLDNSSPSPSTRIHNSVVAGYKNAMETLLGFVLFFAEAGPTMLIWLVMLLVPAFLLVRRYRRATAAI